MSEITDAYVGGWIDMGNLTSDASWPDDAIRNVAAAASGVGVAISLDLPDPASQLVQPGVPYRVFNNAGPGSSSWLTVGPGEAWEADINEGYMAEFISDGSAWICLTPVTGSDNASSTNATYDEASTISYAKYIDITITANSPNLNIYELARDREGYTGEDNTKITVRIPFGVTIGSTSADSPAITTGDSANYGSGCLIFVENQGRIIGFGGNGGSGGVPGESPPSAGNGGDGGDAIHAKHGPFLVHNIGGVISGGGGGGGGSGNHQSNPGNGGNGGAGGLGGNMNLNGALLGSFGGLGYPGDPFPGNSGTGGTQFARGGPGLNTGALYGDDGGEAGAFAEAGQNGTSNSGGSIEGAGGAAGRTFVKQSASFSTTYRGFGTINRNGIGYQSAFGDGVSGPVGLNSLITLSTTLFTLDGTI